MTEVFIISVLSIIFLAIQIIINFWLEWRRQEKEDKRLNFERRKHEEQLELERQKFRLEKKQLRREKYQNFLDYQNRLQETYLQYLSTLVPLAEKLGVDLSKGDLEGQVEAAVKRVSQPGTSEERVKEKKELLRAKRRPKK